MSGVISAATFTPMLRTSQLNGGRPHRRQHPPQARLGQAAGQEEDAQAWQALAPIKAERR